MDSDRSGLHVVVDEPDEGGRAVVVAQGVVGPERGTELIETLADLAARGFREIVLDVNRMEFEDASGVGLLVRAQREVEAAGGRLRLRRVPAPARRMLLQTGAGPALGVGW